MINVLLDPLPEGYEDENGTFYPMDFDFRIGIQVSLLQDDPELDDIEKILLTQDLIFAGDLPDDPEVIKECVNFFINGWYQDRHVDKHVKVKTSDFNVDQWRIYSAFLTQYQIDLNSIEFLHYWVFMGLLSTLDECAYTRVLDIRSKDVIPKGLKGKELQDFKDAKYTYALGAKETQELKDEKSNVEAVLGNLKKLSKKEQKRVEIFESYSDEE